MARSTAGEVRFICLFRSGILGVRARAPSLPSLPSVPSPPSFRSRPLPTFTKPKELIGHPTDPLFPSLGYSTRIVRWAAGTAGAAVCAR